MGTINESLINLIFKVKKNSIIMLKNRGYAIPSDEEFLLNSTLVEFIEKYEKKSKQERILFREALNNVYSKEEEVLEVIDDENNKSEINIIKKSINVYFINTSEKANSIGKESISPIITGIANKRSIKNVGQKVVINDIILITELDLSSGAKASINQIDTVHCKIQHFLYQELSYIPINHYLVPKHELLTYKQLNILKKEIDILKLPKITTNDVICKYYGGVSGQVFKIYRDNTIAYRYVIRPLSS
jgi:DNA-directed RNA polymerase subunit H (RpoH/RPB5)